MVLTSCLCQAPDCPLAGTVGSTQWKSHFSRNGAGANYPSTAALLDHLFRRVFATQERTARVDGRGMPPRI